MRTAGVMLSHPTMFTFMRFAVLAFFAIVFLQSSFNKIADPDGNKAYFGDFFKSSPTMAGLVEPLFWGITLLELLAGVLCALGVITFSFRGPGFFACWGLRFATFSLLALVFGARMAKDYATASTTTGYFAVALLGHVAFSFH